MTRPPPRSTHTDTPVPYPTPFRSLQVRAVLAVALRSQQRHEFGERLRDPARLRGIGGVEEDHQHVHGMTLGGQPPADVVETGRLDVLPHDRSEEHTSELQSLMRISYAVFCLKKKTQKNKKAQ